MIISVKSFNNSIKNSEKAEATYKINLHKDSLIVKNLKEINSNTKIQTDRIEMQLGFSKRQMEFSERQLTNSEKSLEEQISRGTPQYFLVEDKVINIDSLGIGSLLLYIKTHYSFTGSRTAYNVEFRRFIIINDEINDKYMPNITLDVIPNLVKEYYSQSRYYHKIDILLMVTEVTWLDKYLNKPHSNTIFSEYNKYKKIFSDCNSKVKKDLFDKINSSLKKEKMQLLRPDS